MRQYRQGDVLLEEAGSLPPGLKKRKELVVARGEATGHAHRFDLKLDTDVHLYETEKGELWIKVDRPAPLVHEEHETLVVQPEIYRYISQREYQDAPRQGYQRSLLD